MLLEVTVTVELAEGTVMERIQYFWNALTRDRAESETRLLSFSRTHSQHPQ